MSISSEITRITNAVANAYTEADAKGAEMPSALTVANLAQTIASIQGGGGSGLYVWEKYSVESEYKVTETTLTPFGTNVKGARLVEFNGEICTCGTSSYAVLAYENNAWVSKYDAPHAPVYGGVCEYRGELHYIGGTSYTNAHYAIPKTGQYRSVTTLPVAMQYITACVYHDEIHVIGGYQNARANHYIYNGDQNAWRNAGEVYSNQLYNYGLTVYNDKLYLIGGALTDGEYRVYDGNNWETFTLPFKASQIQAVTANGYLYVAGGTDKNELYKYDGNNWEKLDTTISFNHASFVEHEGNVYCNQYANAFFYEVLANVETKTFVGYVIDDDAEAYPDDGKKDGFYYKKIVSKLKYAIGTASQTSSALFTIPHNLDFVPNWFVVVALGGTQQSYTQNVAYVKSFNEGAYYRYYRGNGTTKTVSRNDSDKNSLSVVYNGAIVTTVPYMNSSYPFVVNGTYLWACGE